jgi:hypothetical protein
MKRLLPATLLASVLVVGCGKKESTAPAPTAAKPPAVSVSDAGAGDAVPPSAPDAQAAPAGDASGPEIDPAVKAAIQKYISKKGAPPRSWIDLTVEQGYLDRIPTGKNGQPLDFEKAMAKLKIQQQP